MQFVIFPKNDIMYNFKLNYIAANYEMFQQMHLFPYILCIRFLLHLITQTSDFKTDKNSDRNSA